MLLGQSHTPISGLNPVPGAHGLSISSPCTHYNKLNKFVHFTRDDVIATSKGSPDVHWIKLVIAVLWLCDITSNMFFFSVLHCLLILIIFFTVVILFVYIARNNGLTTNKSSSTNLVVSAAVIGIFKWSSWGRITLTIHASLCYIIKRLYDK